jgi:phospholipid-binding lipoprotein MlaA
MKTHLTILPLAIGLSALALTGCTSTKASKRQTTATVAATSGGGDGKSVAKSTTDLEEYDVPSIPDPIEPVNRGTFWFNHQLYRFVLRPISKGYEKVVPQPVRKGIYNVFDNVEFPVRFVNHALQGNFVRAGQETGKFCVNSTLGVGGLMTPAEKFPAIANVPDTDTGLTFAKWGIGHGFYLMIPVVGPRSARDTVGLAGDYCLHPLTWVGIIYGTWAWTIPVSAGNTLAVMPDKFGQYDAATENAVDPYIAVRSAYVQYREEAAKK